MFTVIALEFSKVVISFILLAALFSKKDQAIFDIPSGSNRYQPLLDFLVHAHMPVTFSIAYLLLGSASEVAPLVGSLFLLTLMVSGVALRKLKVIESCNCYGKFARDAASLRRIFTVVLFLLSVAIVVNGLIQVKKPTGAFSDDFRFLEFMSCILVAFIIGNFTTIKDLLVSVVVRNRPDHTHVANHAELEQGKVIFSDSLVVGSLETGERVSLGDIAQTCPLILFVGMSLNCPTCNSLKPLLFRLAEAFSSNLRTVFVFEGTPGHYPEAENTLVLTGTDEFFSTMDNAHFPFSVVIHSKNLGRVGEVEYAAGIWGMFFRVLSVTTKIR